LSAGTESLPRNVRAAGSVRLLVAAKVDPADVEYHEREIAPLLADPHVAFLGEIGEEEKSDFLGGAAALLFPIDWPEPFGLVMIEALACGTPVIAYRGGAVEEIVEDGSTGFIVSSVAEALEAIERLDDIDRRRCRAVFERRFTAVRMARDYELLYEEVRAARRTPWPVRPALVDRRAVAEAS